MATENWYLKNKPRIMREIKLAIPHYRKFIAQANGKDVAGIVVTETVQRFEALLPDIPYIGGSENILTENLYLSAAMLGMYQSLKAREKSVEEVADLIYRGTASLYSGFHSTYTIATPCAPCHEHEGNTLGSAGRRHLDGILWGGGDCTGCHAAAVNSPNAQAVGGPAQRSAINPEFGLAYGHKKSGRGAVTVSDCIICHLEGNFTTQSQSGVHGDVYIDLRDPDAVGIVQVQRLVARGSRCRGLHPQTSRIVL